MSRVSLGMVGSNHLIGGAKADRPGIEVTLTDGSIIQVGCMWVVALRVTVLGPSYCIAEVGEMLAWLGAALHSSSHSEGIVYRTPFVSEIQPKGGNRIECVFGFADTLQDDSDPGPSAGGQCWHGLFRNPVVVLGYPISRRHQDVLGLDLPLDIMAELTQTRYLNPFAGKLCLKGFSTMVVATAASDTLVTWHLLHNPDGSRISYLRSTAMPVLPATVSQLERCRHVLGWCPEMKIYAGRSPIDPAHI